MLNDPPFGNIFSPNSIALFHINDESDKHSQLIRALILKMLFQNITTTTDIVIVSLLEEQ